MPFASDSDQAIRQFDVFLDEWISDDKASVHLLDLEEANILALFAKVFGTGSFLCEQFTKMQYRTLLPLFEDLDQLRKSKDTEIISRELQVLLEKEDTVKDKINRINHYKDLELFRIDMAHLVYPGKTFIHFSKELNHLAETILSGMLQAIYDDLVVEFGEPLRHGKVCRFALVALGKFGAREMGYASDIELVCIYDGGGYTSNKDQSITNGELFINLVLRFKKSLQVKEDGIFNLDLRLRPHGESGLACKQLETMD